MKTWHLLAGGVALAAIGYFVLSNKRPASVKDIVLSKNWFHPSGESVNSAIADVFEDGTVTHVGNSDWVGKFDGANSIIMKNSAGATVIWTAA
jgi:hypothetical protein